jgi:hypothetical protein
MNFEEYIINLFIGTFGGLVSGIFLVVYLNLLPQNSSVAFWGAFFVAFIPFILFVLLGWVIIKGEKINLFKRRRREND